VEKETGFDNEEVEMKDVDVEFDVEKGEEEEEE